MYQNPKNFLNTLPLMLCPHYINTCALPLLMLQWCHMVRLRLTLAQAMAWCLIAPSHHPDQHWHLITDIQQHWPRPWHVTWRYQATTQDQWWDIVTGICQHCPRPWPDTARCQATTWANAEIACVNPLANTYGSFNTNTSGIIPWDQPEKYI